MKMRIFFALMLLAGTAFAAPALTDTNQFRVVLTNQFATFYQARPVTDGDWPRCRKWHIYPAAVGAGNGTSRSNAWTDAAQMTGVQPNDVIVVWKK